MIAARPPQGIGLQGGDIAARVSVFVAVVGIIVDLVLGKTLAKGSDIKDLALSRYAGLKPRSRW